MIGRTISHYRIVEKLGEGGMGVVYKAEDTQLRRTVALKLLPRETLDEEEVKARLIREAQAAASLDHPNICQVFGIHEEAGETFIAMAYIDGPSLARKTTAAGVIRHGFYRTKRGKRRRYRCRECGQTFCANIRWRKHPTARQLDSTEQTRSTGICVECKRTTVG